MKRLTTAIVMTLCLSLPLQAEVYDPFVSQLKDQGYANITIGRTWLGRIVISANRDDMAREIVLNARTGEILGDQASVIGARVVPHYTTSDDSNDDQQQATAVANPQTDTVAASVADIPADRMIMDTGIPDAVAD